MDKTLDGEYEWAKDNTTMMDEENSANLDLTGLPLQVDVSDIDLLPNERYALLRKNGLGCSDSSIILNVNPYKSRRDLIEEKGRDFITDEERAVGDKSAVRKGRDLEPFIIWRSSQIMQRQVIKPVDMYRNTEFPFLTVNYDGVLDKVTMNGQSYPYIPNEIKVVTTWGTKHYNREKAFFRESRGWSQLPAHFEDTKVNSIDNIAAEYGIPPYYYTQLQMEMFHLNAQFGFLTALFEKDWEICTWFVWRDPKVQNKCVVEGLKIWNQIAEKKHVEFDEKGLIKGIGVTDGRAEAEQASSKPNYESLEAALPQE